MRTTAADIRKWLDDAPEDATHMVVFLDSFDGLHFPVYVTKTETGPVDAATPNMSLYASSDIGQFAARRANEFCRLVECYDLAMNVPAQLAEHRAMHF